MNTCECGQPATRQVTTGHAFCGLTWQTEWRWMCADCATESDRERDIQRAT